MLSNMHWNALIRGAGREKSFVHDVQPLSKLKSSIVRNTFQRIRPDAVRLWEIMRVCVMKGVDFAPKPIRQHGT